MRTLLISLSLMSAGVVALWAQGAGAPSGQELQGKRLFQDAMFGGNGRTCQTCHSQRTGTVSPEDAQKRFQQNPSDPLFLHDGSDSGFGQGVSRMLADATVLITIPLPAGVTMLDQPGATSVTLRRGIPTTINTPALDPILMLDGREPTLESQAAGAIRSHAQATPPPLTDLQAIAAFQKTNAFFSTPELRRFFLEKGPAPGLPPGRTASEKRGRVFFEDLPPNPAQGFRPGLCAHCHSGPLLDRTNQFASAFIGGLPIPAGQRFIGVGVSEFNRAGNPRHLFRFPDGSILDSPDPGRALITGINFDPTLSNGNAFKITALRGVKHTAPYFHDNSAKTLEDVAAHYTLFFRAVTGGVISLTPQDEQDMVAYMKLLE